MSPITSHGPRDAFVYMFKVNFNSHNSTKTDVPMLPHVCHQSVTVVISINLVGLSATARVAQACIQSQRARLACGLLSIKEFCVFFVSFFLLLAILDI